MYSFKNDYSEGCHPRVLNALMERNSGQQEGYGDDEYSTEARRILREKIENPKAGIYFVSGGTQANLIVISAFLRPHESVISADCGHINTHEAGAIEATGHKVASIESVDGKITPSKIEKVLDEHGTVPHMVKPKMVYISNSTEIGTVYKKSELEELFEFCKRKDLYLFMDGARLGSALCAKNSDLKLSDIARLTDAFYIGGTKNGALLGEAIVINNDEFKYEFGFHLKQRGALLAKGKVIGIQFLELFRDSLFFDLAEHANKMAEKLATAIKEKGHSFLTESTSNQIFPILPDSLIEKLSKKYEFYIWQKTSSETSAIRLVTSWATDEKIVDRFINGLG